ncbi:MucB/RseB C-terminal domain-containing protein [Pseudidiomarina woesei]|uniref:Sigma E regulatory protein, MucB/RseB n=1 Tax=Pseudidiomarina woesei TaxID=1381080 RepID=A0A0K6GWR4_9GAMM|nr:MucB/RseB C-terminal domain-containing protein [Pseudidiomarina woesei]CUA82958.1 sigma E regulatory protein, MucB/RseB [Pseudidiomarina woesei]
MTKYVAAIALWFAAFASFAVPAQTDERAELAANLGQQWFNRMADALRHLDFEATLVQAQGHRVQPLVWFHGSYDHDTDLELLIYLNGADMRVLRIGEQSYYYSAGGAHAYTLQSNVTFGLIPPAFYNSFSKISQHYQIIASGGMRVTGRNAQYLRLISRDNHRYHYDLWVDRETGMLLKLQMMTPQGEVLEQLQLTSFLVTNELPEPLIDLGNFQQPPRMYGNNDTTPVKFALQPDWLPDGFKQRIATHRAVHDTRLPTDYYLYSDGLTEISVYITESQLQKLPSLALQGPDSMVNLRVNGYAVTVVGKVPAETLHLIAERTALKPTVESEE